MAREEEAEPWNFVSNIREIPRSFKFHGAVNFLGF
jgi:hypothetical protein